MLLKGVCLTLKFEYFTEGKHEHRVKKHAKKSLQTVLPVLCLSRFWFCSVTCCCYILSCPHTFGHIVCMILWDSLDSNLWRSDSDLCLIINNFVLIILKFGWREGFNMNTMLIWCTFSFSVSLKTPEIVPSNEHLPLNCDSLYFYTISSSRFCCLTCFSSYSLLPFNPQMTSSDVTFCSTDSLKVKEIYLEKLQAEYCLWD